MDKQAVKELNAFLKGQYMGVHEYERLIQHTKNEYVKKALQRIQQDHKFHAMQVSERIQNLGGTPVDDVGFMGTIAETMNKLKGTSEDAHDILKEAIKGEDVGVKMSEEIVKVDLDAESKKLIEYILNEDRKHVDQLRNLLN